MGVSTMRGCLPLVCSAILLSTDLSVGQEQCRCLPLRINLNTLVPCPPDRAQPDGRFNSNLTVHAGPGSCKRECESGSSMGCSNLWRNREHEAPRCMTTEDFRASWTIVQPVSQKREAPALSVHPSGWTISQVA